MLFPLVQRYDEVGVSSSRMIRLQIRRVAPGLKTLSWEARPDESGRSGRRWCSGGFQFHPVPCSSRLQAAGIVSRTSSSASVVVVSKPMWITGLQLTVGGFTGASKARNHLPRRYGALERQPFVNPALRGLDVCVRSCCGRRLREELLAKRQRGFYCSL